MNNRKHSNRFAWLLRAGCFAAIAMLPITALATDTDGDGYDDSIDPAIDDPTNYANNIYWYGSALNDDDGDSISNFYDSSPWPDSDGDGLYEGGADGIFWPVDPVPDDPYNFSPNNFYSWSDPWGDADGDFSLNFYDPYPFGEPDSDNDGIYDYNDPFPYDSTNYSPINYVEWYSNVSGDDDYDGILNWEDPTPYDYGY